MQLAPSAIALAPSSVGSTFCADFLHIVEERHESEVHVQLLVAVEQRQAGVIRDKINFGFLVAPEHYDVFQYSRGWLSR